jgi:hypothetical protein
LKFTMAAPCATSFHVRAAPDCVRRTQLQCWGSETRHDFGCSRHSFVANSSAPRAMLAPVSDEGTRAPVCSKVSRRHAGDCLAPGGRVCEP